MCEYFGTCANILVHLKSFFRTCTKYLVPNFAVRTKIETDIFVITFLLKITLCRAEIKKDNFVISLFSCWKPKSELDTFCHFFVSKKLGAPHDFASSILSGSAVFASMNALNAVSASSTAALNEKCNASARDWYEF